MTLIVYRHHRCLVHPELSKILVDPPSWYFDAQVVKFLERKTVNEEKRVAIPEVDLDSLGNGVLTAHFQEPLAIRADGSFYSKREEEIMTLLFSFPLETSIASDCEQLFDIIGLVV